MDVCVKENTVIPEGYKKTELGIIPEDWSIVKAGSVGIFKSGAAFPIKFQGIKSGSYPFLKVSDMNNVGNEIFMKISNNFISELNRKQLCATVFPERSIVFAKVGAAVFLERKKILYTSSCLDNNMAGFIINENLAYYLYIYYIFINTNFGNLVEITALPSLSGSALSAINIPLPPTLPEQSAIASVLSDIDELIENLDKLIEKKKLIKQGAMQELLTGKRRLPGFSGNWELKRLGEIGEISGSGVDKKINPDEEPVRLLNYLDVYKKDFIFSKDLNHWVTTPKMKLNQCSIEKGDVFFTPSSELQTDIAKSAVAMENIDKAVYSYHIVRFRIYENWDLKFRTYIFKTKQFYDQANRNAEGSGKRYVISLSKFRGFKIFYPVDVTEQSAIASVLSDMDAEIEALEQKRDKYKQIKQGAMQVLLTGKIRLI
jgi:type I restriction enzyme S subunit